MSVKRMTFKVRASGEVFVDTPDVLESQSDGSAKVPEDSGNSMESSATLSYTDPLIPQVAVSDSSENSARAADESRKDLEKRRKRKCCEISTSLGFPEDSSPCKLKKMFQKNCTTGCDSHENVLRPSKQFSATTYGSSVSRWMPGQDFSL